MNRTTLRQTTSVAHLIAIVALAAVVAILAMAVSAKPAHAANHQAGSLETAMAGTFTIGAKFTVDGNTYRITDVPDYDDYDDLGEVVLVKYGSNKKAASINTVSYRGERFEVEGIGKGAFNNTRGHRVTSVTLGRNVDRIAPKAFYGCAKLKKLNMAKSDVIDIDRGRYGYHLDDVNIGTNAFKKAGTSKLTVKCGSKNKSFQALYKQALAMGGLRSDAKITK